jgi:sulfite exporter TauE/SafE
MNLAIIIAGLSIGLAGSLHCVGMCGPLCLALPLKQKSISQRTTLLVIYQIGRTITYSFFGLLIGWLGHRISLAGYQQSFSITMGSILIILALINLLKGNRFNIKFLDSIYLFIQQKIASSFRKLQGASSYLIMGIANGFLPCGLVYMALASTLSLTGIGESVAFLASFGLGTIPALLLTGLAGQLIKPNIRINIEKTIPYLILAMGILLVLRGLSLGIPFISPVLPAAAGDAASCPTH